MFSYLEAREGTAFLYRNCVHAIQRIDKYSSILYDKNRGQISRNGGEWNETSADHSLHVAAVPALRLRKEH